MKYLISLIFLLISNELLAQGTGIVSPMSEAETRLNAASPAYDPAIAFKLYQSEATFGNKKAMNALGVLYSQGLGTTQNTQLAIQWFTKALEAGYTNALYNLGKLYQDGIGVKQNFVTAYAYFKRGSEAKSAAGYYGQGYLLFKGLGCTQDYLQAAALFKKAIPKGSTSSMYMLGICYRNGYGVTANTDSARYWINRAASLGYQFAKDELLEAAPENPDAFKVAGIAKTSSSASKTKDSERTFKRVKSNIKTGDISGNYTGYLVKYDWSGQHVIGQSKLSLRLLKKDSLVSGLWVQDDSLKTPISGKITDTSLVFNNTSLKQTDHYNKKNPVTFEFRDASLQLVKNADTVYLTGNLQLWSATHKEPEKPMLVSLVREKAELTNPLNGYPITDADSTVTAFMVYPNPYDHAFNISFTTKNEEKIEFVLADIVTGKIWYREEAKRFVTGTHTKAVVAEIPAGTYILRLVYKKGVKTALVMKK